MHPKALSEMKEARQKSQYTVTLFTRSCRKVKIIETEIRSVIAKVWMWRKRKNYKGAQGTFCGYRNILYFNCDNGCMIVYVTG